MKRLFAFTLLVAVVLMNACQKETSFENGGTSEGTLQSDVSDDCLPKTLSGSYVEGTALDGNTNQLLVTADVTKTGTYTIYTDTVNGVYFLSTGVFPTAGSTAVTLKGFGTPLGAGTFNFQVIYEGGDTCTIAIPFLPAGAGGPATFTFEKTGANCSVTNTAGSYTVGTAVTSANTVTLSVNVTAIGTYNITTTAGGITFTGSGGFTATGVQPVVLTATSGTPTTAGANAFTVTQGASTCTFSITVTPSSGAATGTLAGGPAACLPVTVAGTYLTGTALTAANTVQVQVNVATIGTYSITTNTVTGFSFSASGTFTTTGNNTVTLTGTGSPTTAGSQSFTVTFGSSTCTFVVPVAGPSAATGTLGGDPNACTPVTVAGIYTKGTALGGTNTVQIQANVTTAGPYTINTPTVGGFSFSATGTFATTGLQTVTLNGTGTPTIAGIQAFTVTFGTSTCTFNIAVADNVADYFPRTTNSNWSYEWDDVADDSAFRRTNSTISAAGNTYNVFMIRFDPSGFDSSGYYRKSGGTYSERLDVGDFIGYDDPQWVEYIFLKDDQAQGHNWKSAGYQGTFTPPAPDPPQTLKLRFSYTIIQKDNAAGVSVTTSTGVVKYNNVIVVEEKYELEVMAGVWQDVTDLVGYGKAYYARGIGLIKYEVFDAGNTGSTPDVVQELRRYHVQ